MEVQPCRRLTLHSAARRYACARRVDDRRWRDFRVPGFKGRARKGDDQRDALISPEAQRARIEEACKCHRLRLIEVFEELDISGGSRLKDRTGLGARAPACRGRHSGRSPATSTGCSATSRSARVRRARRASGRRGAHLRLRQQLAERPDAPEPPGLWRVADPLSASDVGLERDLPAPAPDPGDGRHISHSGSIRTGSL